MSLFSTPMHGVNMKMARSGPSANASGNTFVLVKSLIKMGRSNLVVKKVNLNQISKAKINSFPPAMSIYGTL